MKKKYTYVILLITILMVGLLGYNKLFGHIKCSKILVKDFSKTTIDSLTPEFGKAYYTQIVEIKGYTDDSIIIKGIYGYPIYLNGKIDKKFNAEYYGGSSNSIILIQPYKAKLGKLKVKHIIK